VTALQCACGCTGPFRPRPHMREWLRKLKLQLEGWEAAAAVPEQWQCPSCGTDAPMLARRAA
jgi:hypothetical protein